MTIVVGFLPDAGGTGALDLGAQLARSRRTDLTIVTVVPRQWQTPSLAKVDAEHADYTRQVGIAADAAARAHLAASAPDVAAAFRTVSSRSVSAALIQTVDELGASGLVLGSAADGDEGRIVVGSTADRLLHSSPVPLGIAPLGYLTEPGQRVTRVTCAFSDSEAAALVVARAVEAADEAGATIRIASFGVRGGTMFPPEIGLRAEDEVLHTWAEQASAAQQQLVEGGIIEEGVERVIATGSGWRESIASLDWLPGELLVLGSSEVGPIARVFLGSRATKLVRHSPVPVLVVASQPR